MTNRGNGYDNSSGVFRAPIAGAYVFSWTVVNERGHWANVAIKRNGVFYGLAQADGGSGKDNGSGSNTAVLELDAGDEVRLDVNDGRDATSHQVWGGGHSTFSGWLIHH